MERHKTGDGYPERKRRKKRRSLKVQFTVGTGLILFLFCLGGTLLVYNYEKYQLSQTVHKETEIFMGSVEAVRTYVKDVLRPKMYTIVSQEDFIPEAMSTSYVGREVMKRVQSRLSEFAYKRAALHPRNPVNEADEFEAKMISWFRKNPESKEWSGVIRKNGRSYYARLRRIVAEKECMHCHGNPEQAPKALLERYGLTEGGYGYEVGQVVAEDAVYIPVDVAYLSIKKQAWTTFFIGGGVLLTLIVLFYSLFNQTVLSQLKDLLTTFQELAFDREDGSPSPPAAELKADEIGQLTVAFEQVASDLRHAHNRLKDSELKYRSLFEASQDAIFLWDEQKKIIDLNKAAVKMFGLQGKAEALSMESIEQFFWDARDCHRLLEAITQEGFVIDYEASMVNRFGRRLDVLITANLRLDGKGGVSGFQGVMRDVTEKKRLERYLAQTEKLASLGQLAAGVAHEINNPLGVIACYSNLIGKNIEKDSPLHEDLKVIQKHTVGCKRIVEALLSFARVTETKRVKADVQAGLEEVFSVLEQQMAKRGISILRNYASDLPPAIIDPGKMKQVYMNLLMNAMQAMDGQGKITVTTKYDRRQGTIRIVIADTGIGIPRSIRARIFDPFFTTKRTGEGTGLGLSVSYGIVKDHGGDIQVESTPGKGSVFTVILPVE